MRTRILVSAAVAIGLLGPALGAASAATQAGQGPLSNRLFELSSPELRSAPASDQADAVSLLNRGAGSLLRDGGALVVEIRTSGDPRPSVPALRDAGAEIAHVSEAYRTVTASVDERKLRGLARIPQVEYVEEVITPMTGSVGHGDAGSRAINTCATGVVSEGNTQLRAGAARTQFDVDGSGVKVGVLSDSYDTKPTASTHAADDVASGDLPGTGNPCGRTTPVQVLDEPAAPEGDEGRAMLQIVHDLAPGSPLAFATAFGGQTLFADNIRALASSGAEVIVDDIIYFTEPMYQDGIVAKAVNDVTAQGVSYFSMAFNNNGNGVNSYEAPNGFRDDGATTCPATVMTHRAGGADSCMDFDPGPGVDNRFDIDVDAGAELRLSLSWAEPMFGVSNDFDIYLINPNTGDSLTLAAASNNLASQTPTEFGVGGAIAVAGTRQIVIRRYAGTGTPRLKFVSNDNGANLINSTQAVTAPDVQGPTIYGHNGADASVTVGAVPFNNSNTMEAFSGRGPVTSVFAPVSGTTASPPLSSPVTLSKPDVSATDRGINTFFGSGNRFSGTSAAAPHAAAVGALQIEANPALTRDQVEAAQKATARPVGAFGPFDMGAGLIDAQAAIASVPPPAPGVAIGEQPPAVTNAPSLSFGFTTTGDLRSITCQVDAGAVQPCSSPFVTPRPAGDVSHAVTIRATDFFGQVGESTASFTVDTTGPGTTIRKAPKKRSKSRKAKFTFGSEGGARFECALDKKAFAACTSPEKVKVKRGKKHAFKIRAIDGLGNVGASSRYRWKVLPKQP